MKEEQKQQLQQKYLEMQLLEQQVKEVQNHLLTLNQKSQELKILDGNLSEIKKIKEKKEIFSQIGSGVFIKAKLEDTKNVIVDIGANTAIQSTVEDAKTLITEQTKKITNSISYIEDKLENLAKQMQSTQQEMVALQSKS